ncbi:MAG TPA: CaiB/BaiF CoA-transferase family protein [Pirellulales bacterium]|nr:CaiB/BaiF CoA-transferase family protein [Pirellulales bacterium]
MTEAPEGDEQQMDRGYPLAGLKVLDLSRILAGPVCTQLLADLGADVVKVERPGLGDDTRQWGPPFASDGGASGYFLSCNRGKRSLALDLGHPDGQTVLADLVRQADALIENFLPDSLEKLGLTPERLAASNPQLVNCSISGFGRTGPLANTPGYDLTVQAAAGIMSITGEPDGAPMKVGVAITDVITGLYAAASVLAGLYSRGKGRGGGSFDLALADCTLASLVNVAQGALLTGQRPRRYGNAHPQIVPYEAFATADGHVTLAIGADRQWQRFCRAVGREAWAADARFSTNPARVEHREALLQLLKPLFAERTTAAWLALLASAEVPHSPVLAIDEVLQSPQVAAREMVLEATDAQGRSYRLLGGAVHWQGEPPRRAVAPPELGQHTDEVLQTWLGYDERKIQELRHAKAIA